VTVKLDMVALSWVVELLNRQAESAEVALVEFGNDPGRRQALLKCMWDVHQITSTLRVLGIGKGEMLTLEMERGLNLIYKGALEGERLKLMLGGLMQALKVLPAYLAHVQSARCDTGRGLGRHVNDLRRYAGERPRPAALFFHMAITPAQGITPDGHPAPEEEIRSRANLMLAVYLEMAKLGLQGRKVADSMKTVARIARKMQLLFAGTEAERFWLVLVGLCEGIAGGLIRPDEGIAQIFKNGAFMIKQARERGLARDPSIYLESLLQQMLYYIASCRTRPLHIAHICRVFGIQEGLLEEAGSALVHSDAVVTALGAALEKLNGVMEQLDKLDLAVAGRPGQAAREAAADAAGAGDKILEGIEAAQYRLDAAGEIVHADDLARARARLQALLQGSYADSPEKLQQVADDVISSIVGARLNTEHKLRYGPGSAYAGAGADMRESVIRATFNYMGEVEYYLQTILRRKVLASALAVKPFEADSVMRLTGALNRFLNKIDQGHEELRQAIRDAEEGEADLDLLFALSREFLNTVEDLPDRKALEISLKLLEDISGALHFSGLGREGEVIDRCRDWLDAASKSGSVREDDAFRCFADAFTRIELHLERSLADPLADTSDLLAFAEQRVDELQLYMPQLSFGADVVSPALAGDVDFVEDGNIPPQFREVFIEEADEIVNELVRLEQSWQEDPGANATLRDMRRHFHTFKGNGRAVGANILGELGWAAQDMLDRVLDGDLAADGRFKELVSEVVAALPGLVDSYRNPGELDVTVARDLTNRCFLMVRTAGQVPARDIPRVALRAPLTAAATLPMAESLSH